MDEDVTEFTMEKLMTMPKGAWLLQTHEGLLLAARYRSRNYPDKCA